MNSPFLEGAALNSMVAAEQRAAQESPGANEGASPATDLNRPLTSEELAQVSVGLVSRIAEQFLMSEEREKMLGVNIDIPGLSEDREVQFQAAKLAIGIATAIIVDALTESPEEAQARIAREREVERREMEEAASELTKASQALAAASPSQASSLSDIAASIQAELSDGSFPGDSALRDALARLQVLEQELRNEATS